MTAAAVVFCCVVALAFVEGYGAPAFTGTIASDAFDATLPFLGLLLVARFFLRRRPDRATLVHRLHAAAQGALAAMAFGWWWIEPHVFATSLTGSSLAAMGWQAVAGAAAGFGLALIAERASSPAVLREVWAGAGVLLLIAGGRAYRARDHVEAGVRLEAAAGILAATVAAALVAYFVLRRRERVAASIPALAPAAACLALLAASFSGQPASLSARDSVLLVVVDTLRADVADDATPPARPGVRTMPGAMPELARIAKDGVRFTQAVSPAPWTLPATVSLLGGWNPHRHRYGRSLSAWEVTTGDPAALYLGDALRDAGYLPAAFVNNPYLRPYFGFGEGFYAMRPYHGRALDGVALALDWLSDHGERPTFTMLHLMDPHWPYDAPPGFGDPPRPCASCGELLWAQYGTPKPEERAELERRYAAEVRFTDAMIGRLYDTLAAAGFLERTWLVVTSDHGEEFWEHGELLHGHGLWDELLRVPLVVVPPRGRDGWSRGARIDRQVRLEDVAASVLEIAGVDPALARDGKSLLPLVAGEAEAGQRVAIGGYVKSVDDLSHSVRQPPWKAIVAKELLRNRLFDLRADPGEQRSLLFRSDVPEERRKWINLAFLGATLAPGQLGLDVEREPLPSSERAPDRDTANNLRSLGYAE